MIGQGRERHPYGVFVALVFLVACHHAQSPPSCPSGAVMMGAAPPKGTEQWCQKLIDGKAVKDGTFIVYNTAGGKMIEGDYRNGIQDGEWTVWYENGARASIDHYRDGVKDGLHTTWYANGQKALEGEYRNGKREGVWIQWDPSGLSSRRRTYNDGKLTG